jgi:hypothetical protein
VYACHTCGLNGHKITSCPKFIKMQKMFQGKNAYGLDMKMVFEVNIVITYVNVIDVNVVTRRRIIKEQVFQEKKPRKNKSIIDWKEEKLKKTMVGIIQQL